jgi:hypothetical protein
VPSLLPLILPALLPFIVVVPPTGPMDSTVVVLVDSSRSMEPATAFNSAINFTLQTIAQDTERLRVKRAEGPVLVCAPHFDGKCPHTIAPAEMLVRSIKSDIPPSALVADLRRGALVFECQGLSSLARFMHGLADHLAYGGEE